VRTGETVVIVVPVQTTKLAARIRGRVVLSDGTAPQTGKILLFHEQPGVFPGIPVFVNTVNLFTEGGFDMNVAAGRYVLKVLPDAPHLSWREHTTVALTADGENIDGFEIRTRPSGSLHGRFVFDTGPPADLQAGSFYAVARAVDSLSTAPAGEYSSDPDWTFSLTGLVDPIALSLGVPSHGWMLKAVMHNGRDVIDVPFDFTDGKRVTDVQLILTRSHAGLTGSVVASGGAVAPGQAVVVFTPDAAKWSAQSRFVEVTGCDERGRFTLAGLPAGEYLAAAIDFADFFLARDPEFLRQLAPGAMRVTLSEGAPLAVTLPPASY
jgi:hypothetical protein